MLYQVAAHIDERGKANGGRAGDQTGREVSVSQYSNYSRGWDGVLRLQQGNLTKAEYYRALNRLMHCAVLFANCKHIGYDQFQRNTLRDYMLKRKWKMSQIKHISQDLECDCSSLMGVVATCALKPIKAMNGAIPQEIYTGNMRELFTRAKGKARWVWIDSGINFTNGKGLKRGDILLNETHHTGMFIGNSREGQYYC